MIEHNLEEILKELPSGVKLVAVSKYHPVEDVAEAYKAGQRCFAESRPQEFHSKQESLPSLVAGSEDVEWHFIGHLQTNKLKFVLPYVSLVQSVDSLHLLDEINKWGVSCGKVVDVLLEMHIAAEDTKQGMSEEDILELMFRYYDSKTGGPDRFRGVRICGLMGMATNTDDMAVVDADFGRIDSFMAYLVDLFPELDSFDQLSIGMSGDWRVAVRHGATMVRIGSAIFGDRA